MKILIINGSANKEESKTVTKKLQLRTGNEIV